MRTIYKLITVIVLMAIISTTSCKKLVLIPPPSDQIADNNVYTNNETAISVLTGLYTQMGYDEIFTGNEGISALTGLSADELSLHNESNSGYIGYYRNHLSQVEGFHTRLWTALYNYIFKCNAAVEGLSASESLTPAIKQQLLGEAKFMRAFCYFYLINLFGDAPLATTSDYKMNALLSRTPKSEVYQQIVSDLKEAQTLLSGDYLDGSLHPYTDLAQRVRPTKWAATALLSRTYLYIGEYSSAETEATILINNSSLYSLSTLQDAFKANSSEAIWQLQPAIIGHNTEDGWAFIIPPTGPNGSHPVYVGPQLLNNFETDDERQKVWIDSIDVAGNTYYYPFKYKSALLDEPVTEYLMVLRLGEQFLIRAEARAQQDNVSGSQSDLNTIRTRANLPNTTATDKTSLLAAIQHERQVELFTEWGHRWLDLKRTNTVDAVMSVVTPLKANGAAWESYQQLYPLPLSDIETAPNLVQNSGY